MKSKEMEYDEIIKKLNTNRISRLSHKKLNLQETDPHSLLTPMRFDLMAKYIYAWFWENGIQSNWGKRLYEEHIWIFNNYDEDDGSGKKGIKAFFKSFNATLTSIKKDGFKKDISLLPISKNNVLLDGAHRLTAALLFKHKVQTIVIEDDSANYNYEFFRRKGLRSKWSDAMAYEYCKQKEDTFIALTYPNPSSSYDEVQSVIREHGQICYQTTVTLTLNGLNNLVNQLRENRESFKKHFMTEFQGDFNKKISINVIMFHINSTKNLSGIKRETQSLNSEGNLLYIAETQTESLSLAQIFFNRNSIQFLNNAPLQQLEELENALERYREYIDSQQDTDSEYFCVVSDTVLTIHGITGFKKLGFVQYSGSSIEDPFHLGAVDYSDMLNGTSLHKDEIIFNPENHFYYKGMKFATVSIIKKIKSSKVWKCNKELRLLNSYLRRQGNSTDMDEARYYLRKKIKVLRLHLAWIRLKIRKSIKERLDVRNSRH